jgi:hypothetical protein
LCTSLTKNNLQVSVKLPNGLKHEGHVLYVNRHYNIAILKVCVGSSMDVLHFGSMPRYGQRVLALGRDSMDLLRRDGVISKLERTVLGRTHYMFPKSADGFSLVRLSSHCPLCSHFFFQFLILSVYRFVQEAQSLMKME